MANDVVVMDSGEVAEAWFHAEVDGFSWSCVSPWPFVSEEDGCCKHRKSSTSPTIVSSSRLSFGVIYSATAENGISRVILPAALRR